MGRADKIEAVAGRGLAFLSRRIILLLLVALPFLFGCAAKRVYGPPPNPFNPVYTVAVLPLYNTTNDVAGPRMVRKEFQRRLKAWHYSVMPLKDVDRILMDRMGITLGSQLELTDPGTVGRTLGVDGVVYGYLLNFDDITTGVYNVKQVRAGFKLVDTSTAGVIWSGGLGVKSFIVGGEYGAAVTALKELTGSDVEFFNAIKGLGEIPGIREWHVIRVLPTKKLEEAAVLSLGEHLLTSAFGVHLKAETNVMLKRVMRSLPAGPGAPPAVREPLAPAEGMLRYYLYN